jgi:hypothetical protein
MLRSKHMRMRRKQSFKRKELWKELPPREPYGALIRFTRNRADNARFDFV